MSSDYTYMVCTRCMTFNHHAYIEDAMNGFCMQQTNFPFVCVIVDDASTDGEPEVIKKYFDTHFDLSESGETDDYVITFGRHKTNENCYFAVLYLKYNHYSIKKDKVPYYAKWQDRCKYIALCEGDDYWIAADKLQMQTDFLEENKEYGMCYSLAKGYIQTEHKFVMKTIGKKIDSFEQLLKGLNTIPTLTTFFKKEIYERYIEEIKPSSHNWMMGDYPMWLYILHETKVRFFNYVTGVYRILNNSASHSTNISKLLSFKKSGYDVTLFFSKKYNVNYNDDLNLGFFIVYVNYMKNVKYDTEYAKQLRVTYKQVRNKQFKHIIYYVFSYNKILWYILLKILNCFK